MRSVRLLLLLLAPLSVASVATGAAQGGGGRDPVAPVPPGLTEVPDDDGAVPLISPQGVDDPEIRIRTEGDTTVEEYRRDGRVVMIKVTPRLGPPYYLIDNTGNGQFLRHDGPFPMTAPAQWRIYQF